MVFGIALTGGFLLFVWLVFFKFRWLTFSPAWAIVSAFIFLHVLFIFLIGLRFMTPSSMSAHVIQHTIQLTPRLTEPTLVTKVLVEPDVPVKKGQPLFQFDRRVYEARVQQLEAELAQAKQNVRVLKADEAVAKGNLSKAQSELEFAKFQQQRAQDLARSGAGSEEEAQKWTAQLAVAQASVSEAGAQLERAKLRYESEVGGVNTSVAAVEAQLVEARYYLDNTTMVAPADGRIFNLQVRPGMVAGEIRLGAIASFVCDDDRYLLASYFMENLKYVKPGQPVEVALTLYPGQIFRGRVDAIWKANSAGQLLPSGRLPDFEVPAPDTPQGQYAVKIVFLDEDQSKFPIGAQGTAAIYTQGMPGAWSALRRIALRADSWLNWLYPMPF